MVILNCLTEAIKKVFPHSHLFFFSREKFIPITRRSLIRHLLEKDNFLNDEEKRKFEDFALALDSAIVNKYHGVLQELKVKPIRR